MAKPREPNKRAIRPKGKRERESVAEREGERERANEKRISIGLFIISFGLSPLMALNESHHEI